MSNKYENPGGGKTPITSTPTEAIFIAVAQEENQIADLVEQEVEKIHQILCTKPCVKELYELENTINRFLTNLILKEVVLAVKLNEALALADVGEEC